MKQVNHTENELTGSGAPDARRILLHNKPALAALVVLSVFFLAAISADQMAPFDPLKTSGETFRPPSQKYLFGTDDLGRDIFSGVLYGARSSLSIGLTVALLSGLIGTLAGAAAGYLGDIWDDLLMRLTEFFLIPPKFFLALVVAALFGASMLNLIVVLTVTYWTTTARIVRAEVLSLKARSFVEASRALGASHPRILFCTILPNVLPLIITNTLLVVGQVVLLEAALDFIGLGDASRVSWGAMLHNAQHFIRDGWWMVVFPSLALALVVIALNVVGDALNTALDPKARSAVINKAI